MEIKILGLGCSKCKVMESQVKRAVEQLQMDVTITKVERIQDIVAYGVLSTPALVIDNVVKIAGRIASLDEIKQLIQASLKP